MSDSESEALALLMEIAEVAGIDRYGFASAHVLQHDQSLALRVKRAISEYRREPPIGTLEWFKMVTNPLRPLPRRHR